MDFNDGAWRTEVNVRDFIQITTRVLAKHGKFAD